MCLPHISCDEAHRIGFVFHGLTTRTCNALKNFNRRLHRGDTNRGIAYRDKGDTDRAIADLTEAIRLDPKNAHAYVNRGLVYEKLADFARARSLATGECVLIVGPIGNGRNVAFELRPQDDGRSEVAPGTRFR